jgi:peptidoglycan/xylan/chitin deacetylase (PgdA/CDA1 family)
MLNKYKYILKLFIAFGLYYTGILHILLAKKLKNKAVVLMYHRVLKSTEITKSNSHHAIIITEQTFKKHLKFLIKNFNILNPDNFQQYVKNRFRFEKKSCLITFDDGWNDNYHNAFPVLKKHNIPAVIFLSTSFINSDKIFWQESFRSLFKEFVTFLTNHNNNKTEIEEVLNKLQLNKNINFNYLNKQNLLNDLQALLKSFKEAEREDLLKYMEKITGDHKQKDHPDKFLTWDKIREMEKEKISFEPHGENHKILTTITRLEVESEIMNSVNTIKKELNRQSTMFSYPNGNFNQQTIEVLKEINIPCAFTTNFGYLSNNSKDYELPRINIQENNSGNIPLLICTIIGLF